MLQNWRKIYSSPDWMCFAFFSCYIVASSINVAHRHPKRRFYRTHLRRREQDFILLSPSHLFIYFFTTNETHSRGKEQKFSQTSSQQGAKLAKMFKNTSHYILSTSNPLTRHIREGGDRSFPQTSSSKELKLLGRCLRIPPINLYLLWLHDLLRWAFLDYLEEQDYCFKRWFT